MARPKTTPTNLVEQGTHGQDLRSKEAVGGCDQWDKAAMISFSHARVVVVAGADVGRPLVNTLTRMGLAGVRLVANPDQARQLCTTKNADACLVVLPRAVPDEAPPWTAETGAPGREAGIPSLLLAQVVTPYVTKSARRAGYVASVPADVSSRLLYRWMGALLQKQRRENTNERARPKVPLADAMQAHSHEAWGGKFKLQ